jgi:hypothetical protein
LQSGFSKETLGPSRNWVGVDKGSFDYPNGFVSDLFTTLAKHLGFAKFPRIDQDAMVHELTAAIAAISES